MDSSQPETTTNSSKTSNNSVNLPQNLLTQKIVPRARTSSERVRDHLANERTYLAWMRTAIALVGFGILIARLRYLISPEAPSTGYSWALGLMFAGNGLLIVLLSTQHYFSVLDSIENDTYQPTKRWVILFSMIVVLLGIGVLYVLLTMPDNFKLPLFWQSNIVTLPWNFSNSF